MISNNSTDSLASIEDNDASSQLSYLMAQSEAFCQFMANGEQEQAGADKKTDKKKSSSKSKGGRTRKTEEAEDRELMKASQNKAVVTRLLSQPTCIVGGTMRPYQLEGLNWLIKLHDSNINGILADEMGLGKTLQTISLLVYLAQHRQVAGPHLILVPKSTVSNWLREFNFWCTGNRDGTVAESAAPNVLRVMKLLGDKDERAAQTKRIKSGDFDVVVASFESCLKEQSTLKKIQWKYVVIDEAHRIKNENSSLSVVVRLFNTDYRLLITGTPLQNNLHELWSLLNFIMPAVFSSSDTFDVFFNTVDSEAKDNVIKKLHTILKPFMLRRVKADVEKDLPPKKETKLYIGMSALQTEWYTKVLNKDIDKFNALGGVDKVRLLNILMQLRKVCNHPYLFEGAEEGPPYIDGPHLWETSGKLVLLDKLLPRLYQQDSRVLIFCQMTRMLDVLEDYLAVKAAETGIRYQYCRLDGSTSGDDRDIAMEQFNAPDSPFFLFLLSTRAGGLGINLQTADTVILFDSDWNPQVDLQAMDRAHRIGQKKPVQVFRFITEGTVEEKIIERADRKLFLDAAVIQQGRLAQQNTQLSKGEIMQMVHFGADEILKNKGGTISDTDIDALLQHGYSRTDSDASRLQTQMQHSLANFSVVMDEAVELNMFNFGGESYNEDKKSSGNAAAGNGSMFLALPQRDRKRNSDIFVSEGTTIGTTAATSTKRRKQPFVFYQDYQFFNNEKLAEIVNEENRLYDEKQVKLQCYKELKGKESKLSRRLQSVLKKKVVGAAGGDEEEEMEEGLTLVIEENQDPEEADASNPTKRFPLTTSSTSSNAADVLLLEQYRQQMQELNAALFVDKVYELSSSEASRKKALLAEGFANWTRKEFKSFLEVLEKYGDCGCIASGDGKPSEACRQSYLNLITDTYNEVNEGCVWIQEASVDKNAGSLGSNFKSEEDIIRFVTVFMQRHGELSDTHRVSERMAKGNKRSQQEVTIQLAIARKVISLCSGHHAAKTARKKNHNQVNHNHTLAASVEPVFVEGLGTPSSTGATWIKYGNNRGKLFSEDEDVFLLFLMYKYKYNGSGFGSEHGTKSPSCWDKMRWDIRQHPAFRYDWYFKSRNSLELQKRCDILTRIVEKEYVACNGVPVV